MAFVSSAQTQELVEVIRRWPNRIDVTVTDGLVHKRVVSDQSDSAFYFHSNGKKYLATTTFKEIGTTTPPVEVPSVLGSIDNVDARNVYFGNWLSFNNAVFHNGTSTYATVVNSTITITFIGKRIEWWTEKTRNKGIAGLSIDNGPEINVDIYANTTVNGTEKVWESPLLSAGQHTLKIRLTNTKNPLATETTIIHDRILVTQ